VRERKNGKGVRTRDGGNGARPSLGETEAQACVFNWLLTPRLPAVQTDSADIQIDSRPVT